MNKVYLTNNYMVNGIASINKVAPFAKGKTAYAMLKVRGQLQNELAPFEEARQAIFERYGEEKDGQLIVKKEDNEENYDKFVKELTELLNIGMDVELYNLPEEEFELEFEGDITLYDYDLVHSLVCGM